MSKNSKFEIKSSNNGQDYFVLKARNGKVILVSETYKSLSSLRKGIESVRLNVSRKGAFVKSRDKSGEFRFTLRANNNKTIGQSEGYKTRLGRWMGITSVKLNAPKANIIEK